MRLSKLSLTLLLLGVAGMLAGSVFKLMHLMGRDASARRDGGHPCRVVVFHSRRVDQVLKTALCFIMVVGAGPKAAWGQFCGQSYEDRIAAIHRQAGQLPGHQPTLLLTGSSSIRLWPDAPRRFRNLR